MDNEDDKKALQTSNPEGQNPGSTQTDDGEQKAPLSVRDSIRASIKEISERDGEVKPEPKEIKEPKDKPELKEAIPGSDAKDKSLDNKSDDNKSDDNKSKEDNKAPATPVPVSWSKEAKEQWNSLPPAIQAAVSKREKEFSDGIKQYSDGYKFKNELEPILASVREGLKQHNVSDAQYFNRLHQVYVGLANPESRESAFAKLAADFGVDLKKLVPQGAVNNELPDDQQQFQQFEQKFNGVVDTKFGALEQRLNSVMSAMEQAQQVEAKKFVDNWAKDKPHFERVKGTMKQLIESRVVDAQDLDKAYQMAIRLDEDLFSSIEKEKADKAAADKAAKDAAEKAEAEKKRKEQLAKAKSANVSLKSGSPAAAVSGKRDLPKNASIRDSIKYAIQQEREKSA